MNEFYRQVNKNSDNSRYNDWEIYRNRNIGIIETMLSKSPLKSQSKVLVVGAGNCDDIDVNRLKKIFTELYFMDIDTESVKEGLDYQHYKTDKVIELDVTGFKYFNIYSVLLQTNSYEEAMQMLSHKIPPNLTKLPISIEQRLKQYRNFFDVIIFTPIFTQLFSEIQLMIECKFKIPQVKIIADLEKFEPYIYNVLLNIINYLSKPGSLVIGFTDWFELSQKNNEEFANQFLRDYQDSKFDIFSLIKKYANRRLFGTTVFNKVFPLMQCEIWTSGIWNFNDEKWYYVIYADRILK